MIYIIIYILGTLIAATIIFYIGILAAELTFYKQIDNLNDQIDSLLEANYKLVLKLEEAEEYIEELTIYDKF